MAHQTVLLQESIKYLNPNKGETIVDGTVGSGGHASLICETSPETIIIGLDRDRAALKRSGEKLLGGDCKFELHQSDFRNFDKVIGELGIKKIDGLLLDLGLNSEQLENSGRGFSFLKNEPLLMTFDEDERDITAKEILNNWSEESIANIIFGYGEERYARRIAKKIVEVRGENPIEKTFDLMKIIEESVPPKYLRGKTHFATKTFQALRTATNDELEALKEVLHKGYEFLAPGGRIVIISFHSLEDRIVKNFFRDLKNEGGGEILTKKPITPTEEEVADNPRSRSAKLRAFKKN